MLGGGVAGLTAAHELAERGFDVTIYERRARGGKARSFDVPGGIGSGSRRALPGEHGYRIILGVEQHPPDTMRRIPFDGNTNGVFDNLVAAPQLTFARTAKRDLPLPLGALDLRPFTHSRFSTWSPACCSRRTCRRRRQRTSRVDLLRRFGVRLRPSHTVTGLRMRGGRIAGATVRDSRDTRAVHADWYVCALPVEKARLLWMRPMLAADPQLQRMSELRTDCQFYLRRPTPVVNGHYLCVDTPWMVSGISPAQFWPRDFAASYGRRRGPRLLLGDRQRLALPRHPLRQAGDRLHAGRGRARSGRSSSRPPTTRATRSSPTTSCTPGSWTRG